MTKECCKRKRQRSWLRGKKNDQRSCKVQENVGKEGASFSTGGGTGMLKKKNFMAPFYGWGSTASRLEPLRGGSLLFTTKFPEVPGTHFIDLERMKG